MIIFPLTKEEMLDSSKHELFKNKEFTTKIKALFKKNKPYSNS